MIDFLKYRWVVLTSTLVLFLGCACLALYRQQTRGSAFMYSVDFTGGTQVTFRFAQPVGANELRRILDDKGWTGAVIREFAHNEVSIRVREFENDARGLAERIKENLAVSLPNNDITVMQSEAVGAGVGAELRSTSIRAVVIALVVLLAYIAITFWSYVYGLAAVFALVHDAIVMLAFFLVCDRDISITVIGAILAVLGYSINDTIVIFSRIRTNIGKMKGLPLARVVNLSINETLTRTLLTSFTTLLTVLSMVLFGGEALRDFSLTLLIGVIFGTYSSIFIASPVMMMLYKQEHAA